MSIRLATGLLCWLGDLPAVDGVNPRCPLGYLRNGMGRQNGPRHRLEFQCFLLKSFLTTRVRSLQRERERISFCNIVTFYPHIGQWRGAAWLQVLLPEMDVCQN